MLFLHSTRCQLISQTGDSQKSLCLDTFNWSGKWVISHISPLTRTRRMSPCTVRYHTNNHSNALLLSFRLLIELSQKWDPLPLHSQRLTFDCVKKHVLLYSYAVGEFGPTARLVPTSSSIVNLSTIVFPLSKTTSDCVSACDQIFYFLPVNMCSNDNKSNNHV